MLEIRNLTKKYGRTTAVDDLSLETRPGEVLALLGPNGAGKTTTIRCVTGLASPTSGRITIAGHDTRRDSLKSREATGLVQDRSWFYPKVTARELLRYVASIRKVNDATNRIEALLTRFRLIEHADTLTEAYSHGMRQRLSFCAALLGDPQLFIADEPMVGLDVQGHRDVKSLFRELANEGKTVIITTHTLAVAEEVADRIAVVNHGRLIALGTMGDLRQQSGRADGNLEDVFLDLTEPQENAA